MDLKDICHRIITVEEGLRFGTITFSYDSMMSAIKPGHPADILDEILSLIFWDVTAGKTPPLENVKTVTNNLKEFKKCFKVKALNSAIEYLEGYIEESEN